MDMGVPRDRRTACEAGRVDQREIRVSVVADPPPDNGHANYRQENAEKGHRIGSALAYPGSQS